MALCRSLSILDISEDDALDEGAHMTQKLGLITSIAALLLAPQLAAAANASACYNIANADARTYCLARAHRQSGQCYSIQNSAMRSMCLAEVRK